MSTGTVVAAVKALLGRRVISIVVSSLLGLHIGLAQIDTLRHSSDNLFLLARQKAFAGQHEEARILCRAILARDPSYSDARILLGRTIAWDGNYELARTELSKVLSQIPTHRDALDALLDVEMWDQKFDRAADVATRALGIYPNEKDFLYKKARALNSLGQGEGALAFLEQLENIDPSHAGASELRESISRASRRNGVGVRYAMDRFSEIYGSMHFGHLQVSRRTPFGVGFVRINFSRRFDTNGIQPELEFYPTLAAGMYGHLDYGFSASELFPKHRMAAEIYGNLPSNLEASLGLRHLYFRASHNVTIYTGSLGLYHRSYWFSLRPYFTPNEAGVSMSTALTVRWYYLDADNYLMLRGGIGFAADERALQSSAGFGGREVFYLKSQTAGMGWQKSLNSAVLVLATFDVTNQELGTHLGEYVTIYSLSIELRARF